MQLEHLMQTLNELLARVAALQKKTDALLAFVQEWRAGE